MYAQKIINQHKNIQIYFRAGVFNCSMLSRLGRTLHAMHFVTHVMVRILNAYFLMNLILVVIWPSLAIAVATANIAFAGDMASVAVAVIIEFFFS